MCSDYYALSDDGGHSKGVIKEMDTVRVLIVDDEPTIRNGVKRTIEAAMPSFYVVTAENGEAALEHLADVDIVFLDIMMPGMGGLELLRMGRQQHASIRWIVISAYSDFSFAQQALRYGAKDYLLKPIGKQKIIELLHSCQEEIAEDRIKLAKLEDREAMLSERAASQHGAVIEQTPSAAESDSHDIVEMALKFIQKNYRDQLTLEKVAAAVYLNPVYFSHLFKQSNGIGYKEYVIQLRIQKAKELLKYSTTKITDIAEQVGYQDMRHFTQVFRKAVCMTPSEYRSQERNSSLG